MFVEHLYMPLYSQQSVNKTFKTPHGACILIKTRQKNKSNNELIWYIDIRILDNANWHREK